MLHAPRVLRRSVPAAAALAFLGAAGAAHATTVATTDYAVEAQIAAHYAHHVVEPNGTGEFQSGFSVSTTLPKVTFRDGTLMSAGPGATTLSNVDSTAHIEEYTPEGTVTGDCAGSQVVAAGGPTVTEVSTAPLDGGALLTLRPFGALSLLWTCTGPVSFPSGLALPNVTDATGSGPFDLVFTLPREASSMGKVIQLVNQDVALDRCPLHSAYTTECTLHLEGQVTFVRTGQRTEQVPAQAPTTDDEVLTPLPPKPSDADLLEPLIRKTAKLAADGASTTFTFTCGAGCTLTAHAYPGGGGVRAAAIARALATKRVTLAHGGTRTVTMRFGKAARRAIKRAGGVRLALSVTPRAGGRAVRRSVTLKLRAR
jgi:hypothetical protein